MARKLTAESCDGGLGGVILHIVTQLPERGYSSDYQQLEWPDAWRIPTIGEQLFLNPDEDSSVVVEEVQFWIRDGIEGLDDRPEGESELAPNVLLRVRRS